MGQRTIRLLLVLFWIKPALDQKTDLWFKSCLYQPVFLFWLLGAKIPDKQCFGLHLAIQRLLASEIAGAASRLFMAIACCK
jgi:hypothetical protein